MKSQVWWTEIKGVALFLSMSGRNSGAMKLSASR